MDKILLPQIFRNTSERNTLYAHIPFCETRCEYCNFLKFKESDIDTIQGYYVALKKEYDLHKKNGTRFFEAYIGGGTPTINMAELVRFIKHIKKNDDLKQISVETTIRDVTHENVKKLKKIGVNRLSIGIQSFNNLLRNSLNRKEITQQEIIKKLRLAEKNFDTVNIDIIFNLPNQTMDDLKADLEIIKGFEKISVTFYPLIPNKSDKAKKRFKKTDLQKEQTDYNYIYGDLLKQGYYPYTSWNFSRQNNARDEYIIDSDNYIGIGAGSISHINRYVGINTFSKDKYIDSLSKNELPTSLIRELSLKEDAQYYLLTHLFGMKLDKAAFKERYGKDINSTLRFELLILKIFGWVEEKNEIISITKKGMYPIGVVMREFFDSVSELRQKGIDKNI